MAAALGVALLSLGLFGIPAAASAQAGQAQPQPAQAQPAQPQAQSSQAQAQPASARSSAANPAGPSKAITSAAKSNGNGNGRRVTKPLWTELTPAQQQALAPLAGKWNTVGQAQKRKWLALSQNFPGMSGAEQAKLHSRMIEWAALSPQQRTQARLNFGEMQQLSPDDKQAKWEAYQALPPEEKRKLAASAAKPPATAAAVKPVAPEKLANVPKPRRVNRTARIAAAPGQVDHNTLLPQPAPAPAPGQAN